MLRCGIIADRVVKDCSGQFLSVELEPKRNDVERSYFCRTKLMKTSVVIVAAGRGMRAASGDVPKQYRTLNGEMVLARTIRQFVTHDKIDAVLCVIHPDDVHHYEAAIAAIGSKLLAPVVGGQTRQESVYAGLVELEQYKPSNVLIHDAARPFVSPEIIDRVLTGLEENDGAVPALPVTDTLNKVADCRISTTLDRADLWRAQTPQGFTFGKILEAHNSSLAAGMSDFTDDASLAERHGLEVVIVDGDANNIKLTTAQDFVLADNLTGRTGDNGMGEI